MQSAKKDIVAASFANSLPQGWWVISFSKGIFLWRSNLIKFIVTFPVPVKNPANKYMWSFQLEALENIYPLGVSTEESIQNYDLKTRKKTKKRKRRGRRRWGGGRGRTGLTLNHMIYSNNIQSKIPPLRLILFSSAWMLTKHLYFLPYEFYDLILILFLNPVYVLDGVCVCVCVCGQSGVGRRGTRT